MKTCIWTNGAIVTMDDDAPTCEAVLTVGERIASIGSLEDMRAIAPPGVETHDLGGAVMFPGFIEAHNHTLMYGLSLANIDARPSALGSIEAIVAAFEERSRTRPERSWVVARGYDDNQLDERRHPTRHDLDRASTTHPLLLVNGSGHLAVANTLALRLGGVDADTVDPQGGHVVRNEHGEATGLLLETAQRLVSDHIPAPTDADLDRAMAACQERFVASGITSSHTAGINSVDEMRAHQRWEESAEHTLRMTMMMGQSMFPYLRDAGLRTGFGNDRLRIGPLKLFSDGSLIGRTAAVTEPFLEDPRDDNLGMEMMPQDELDAIVKDGHDHGWQVAIHAIGDRAIGMCLDAYRRAGETNPRADTRHRIEHCGILRPDLVQRLVDQGVIPVSQPVFIREYGEGFIRHLGRERAERSYPFRSLLEAGLPLVFSSDCPVSRHEPLVSIQAAVHEHTDAGTGYAPDEAITAREAIRCYTRHGAFAGLAENRVGRITPGWLADFTILRDDPGAVAPNAIDRIPVIGTVIGGALVHEAPIAN